MKSLAARKAGWEKWLVESKGGEKCGRTQPTHDGAVKGQFIIAYRDHIRMIVMINRWTEAVRGVMQTANREQTVSMSNRTCAIVYHTCSSRPCSSDGGIAVHPTVISSLNVSEEKAEAVVSFSSHLRTEQPGNVEYAGNEFDSPMALTQPVAKGDDGGIDEAVARREMRERSAKSFRSGLPGTSGRHKASPGSRLVYSGR